MKSKKIIEIANLSPELIIPNKAKVDYIFILAPCHLKDFRIGSGLTESVKGDFIRRQVIKIGDNSQANFYYCYFGNNNIKVKIDYQIGSQSAINSQVIFLNTAEQKFSLTENYIFQAPNSFGRFITKGLVQDQAKSLVDSKIIIQKSAQNTDSYLDMQAVILNKDSQVELIPGLEIKANNVKASHAARVSMLDDEQIFYLQSRSLDKSQAKKLFIIEMFNGIIKQIPDQPIQQQIENLLNNKLSGRN